MVIAPTTQFRWVQYTITAVFAAVLLIDAGVRVVLTFVLSVDTMVWLSSVIFYVGLFAMLAWMFSYVGRAPARASAAVLKRSVLHEPCLPTPRSETIDREVLRLRADKLQSALPACEAPVGPPLIEPVGACPECMGSKPPEGQGHRPGCSLAAALDTPSS